MGDKTWIDINFFNLIYGKIEKIFGEFEERESASRFEGMATWGRLNGINGGGYTEIQIAIGQKLTFWGCHGAGDEYGPLCFACFEGHYADSSADYESCPVVRVNNDGEVEERNIFDTREYLSVMDIITLEKKKLLNENKVQQIKLMNDTLTMQQKSIRAEIIKDRKAFEKQKLKEKEKVK